MRRHLLAHCPPRDRFDAGFGALRHWPAPCAIGLLLAVCLLGCREGEQAAPEEGARKVRLLTLGSSGLPAGKDFPGRAEPSREAELSFRVSGPLLERPAQQGAAVQQGDLLAKIDPRDFATRVKNTASQLDQAGIELKRMKAGARPEEILQLESSQQARASELTVVQTRLDRFKELLDKGVISQQEYDQVKAEYDVARANLENAVQELEVGRAGAREEDVQAQEAKIDGLEAQLHEAEAALSDTELRAPFSGVIARIYVESFEDVQAKQAIMSIQDISRIDVKVHVSENDIGRGIEGRSIDEAAQALEADATFGSLPGKVFPLKVKEYQTEADPQTQTFEIVLQMENPPGHPVMPGMNATVRRRNTAASEQAGGEGYMVPVESVFADAQGNQCVWVVDPATQCVSRREVKSDLIAEGQIRVTEGLETGETIVTSAANMLSDGMKVAQMTDLRGL
jgi:multidrug efflux system membrane fusion protein